MKDERHSRVIRRMGGNERACANDKSLRNGARLKIVNLHLYNIAVGTQITEYNNNFDY